MKGRRGASSNLRRDEGCTKGGFARPSKGRTVLRREASRDLRGGEGCAKGLRRTFMGYKGGLWRGLLLRSPNLRSLPFEAHPFEATPLKPSLRSSPPPPDPPPPDRPQFRSFLSLFHHNFHSFFSPKTCTFQGPALQTPPKVHEKTPKTGKNENLWWERGKKREILAPPPPPFGTSPFGAPTFSGFGTPTPVGPHPSVSPLRDSTLLGSPTLQAPETPPLPHWTPLETSPSGDPLSPETLSPPLETSPSPLPSPGTPHSPLPETPSPETSQEPPKKGW